MDETLWLDVWACKHLWKDAEFGDLDAQENIRDAAFNFFVDLGSNVAVCDKCEDEATMLFRTVNHGYEEDENTPIPFVSRQPAKV